MGIYLKGLEFYPAVVTQEGTQYVARFLDVPNCLAFGHSAIEAEMNASRALVAHHRFLDDHGSRLPEPSVVPVGRGEAGRVAYIKSPIQHSTAAVRDASMSFARTA